LSVSNELLSRRRIQFIGALGATLAVMPIALGRSGGIWPFLHVTGGALALFALIVEGIRLPSPQRWYAAAGVAISIVVISIVTGGGSLGMAVQFAVLALLGAIYIAVVFWPRRDLQ
jgi:O-antigen ligase